MSFLRDLKDFFAPIGVQIIRIPCSDGMFWIIRHKDELQLFFCLKGQTTAKGMGVPLRYTSGELPTIHQLHELMQAAFAQGVSQTRPGPRPVTLQTKGPSA